MLNLACYYIGYKNRIDRTRSEEQKDMVRGVMRKSNALRGLFLLIIILLGNTVAWGQKEGLRVNDERPLLIVGDSDTTRVGEFLYNFTRNSMTGDTLSLEHFLEMYTMYRRKVVAAKMMRLDTLLSLQAEYDNYLLYHLEGYLLDSNEVNTLYHECYQHMQEEVDVSHILYRHSLHGGEKGALARAEDAYTRLKKGASFEDIARKESDDPTGSAGGRLGYISAFLTVRPFEHAAYNLAVGEVSRPVRSMYGYHLLKVHGRRPTRGRMLVAHLFFARPRSEREHVTTKWRIDSLYQRALAGDNFSELVQRYSQDASTSRTKGVLPWVEAGRYPEEFVNMVFQLRHEGDILAPQQSDFGYHIFKCLRYEPLRSYEESLPRIREGLAQAGIELEGGNAVRRECLQRVGYRIDSAQFTRFVTEGNRWSWHDTTVFRTKVKDWVVAHVGSQSVRGEEVLTWLFERGIRVDSVSENRVASWVHQIATNRAVEMESYRLRKLHPELHQILTEYYDGTLLFEVSQRKHWMSPRLTEEYLRAHYKQHKSKYRFAERLSVDIYRSKDSLLLAGYAKHLRTKGKKRIKQRILQQDNVTLYTEHWTRNHYLAQSLILDGKGRVVETPTGRWQGGCLLRSVEMEKTQVYELYHYRGYKRNVPKSFEDARGEVQYECQEQIGREWEESLRRDIPVQVNNAVWSELLSKETQLH